MVNSDYRKEVGLHIGRQPVPKAVAIAVMAIVVGVAGYTATIVAKESAKHHAANGTTEAPPAPAKPAAPTPAG